MFQEWVLEFLQKYKKNELKITTYNSYLDIYRKHINGSQLGKIKLENVKAFDLQRFYNEKIEDGYNSKTVRAIEVVLNGALDMAFKFRMIPDNPNAFTTIPKKVKYESVVLTMEEVKTIIKETKEDELYPIVVTTVYTGLGMNSLMRKGNTM